MQGKIIKGIAGFYYIYAQDGNVYECKAKGIFRKDNFKPLVGDNAEISVLDQEAKEGSVTAILPRRNSLILSGSCQCGSGICYLCNGGSKAEFSSSGQISDHDGAAGDSCCYLF